MDVKAESATPVMAQADSPETIEVHVHVVCVSNLLTHTSSLSLPPSLPLSLLPLTSLPHFFPLPPSLSAGGALHEE